MVRTPACAHTNCCHPCKDAIIAASIFCSKHGGLGYNHPSHTKPLQWNNQGLEPNGFVFSQEVLLEVVAGKNQNMKKLSEFSHSQPCICQHIHGFSHWAVCHWLSVFGWLSSYENHQHIIRSRHTYTYLPIMSPLTSLMPAYRHIQKLITVCTKCSDTQAPNPPIKLCHGCLKSVDWGPLDWNSGLDYCMHKLLALPHVKVVDMSY